jgi:beta-barrel assembly-enhancing protease
MKRILIPVTFLLLFISSSCDKNNEFHIFSIEDDKKLGAQVKAEIESKPSEYPILSKTQYPVAYQHIERITNSILNSGKVAYKDEFAWEVKIIKDDNVLNAFATPGGYIYVYTGLIKYLDSEDHLAGVLGHEIAHADKRHTTEQLEKAYGAEIVLSVLLGNNSSKLAEMAAAIAGKTLFLKFSRNAETEADNTSVVYLSSTNYQCNGAAGFFEKLIANSQAGNTPEFLSTHPSPDNRVANINTQATTLGCKTTASNNPYQDFKNSLP